MKLAAVILAALGLLSTQEPVSADLYETYLATHGWRTGHIVGACTLAAVVRYPQYGTNVWAAVCTCHTRSVQVSAPSGVNLGPYMRNMITCTLSSALPGVAVIGGEIAHCISNKVIAITQRGGK